ncbi:MAG: CDP-glycerol glycerophosphotransferase family protein [Coriobacteriia bacterium]|nr:CDP-glycerol glycerophosphotransferase family protein [Coriobacteriia bacterium]
MTLLEYAVSAALLRACFAVFRLLPFDPGKVVFASARSLDLQDNLKHIYRAMLARHPDRRYVFLLERYSYTFTGKIRYLASMVRACYHLATARLFIVDNAYLPIHVVRHRTETIVVQVWHAASALKKFGLDAPSIERAVEDRFVHRNYDYVIVGSEGAVEPFSSALRTDPERVVALGEARTDLFFDTAAMETAREAVYLRHPELRGKKVALYAPTFRGAGEFKYAVERLKAPRVRDALDEQWVLVSKVHPALDSSRTSAEGFDLVIDQHTDLNELLLVTDLLITDYSSVIFEYALLRRPLILYVPDLAEYLQYPGFYLDFPTGVIGEIARSTSEVVEIVRRDTYDLDAHDEFIGRHLPLADGHASERFVDWVDSL